jgi:hypothetical protein
MKNQTKNVLYILPKIHLAICSDILNTINHAEKVSSKERKALANDK